MGTAVESAAVHHLATNGFPSAERLSLAGANDRGDIRLRTNPVIIAECKRAQRGVRLTPWMRELDDEVDNAAARYGLLIAKQRGAGDRSVGRWFTVMREWQYHHLTGLIRTFGPCNVPGNPSVNPALLRLSEISPMQINNHLVPSLNNPKGRGRNGNWHWMPFATTYTPGYGATGGRMVLGPLDQFIQLLRWAGLTESTTEEVAT